MRPPSQVGRRHERVRGEAQDAADGDPASPLPQPSMRYVDREPLFVFDWDDTLLPTSWLQRFHLLQLNSSVNPEVQWQVAKLSAMCAQTLNLAASIGTVVMITNSAPGWVAESCDKFMPQLSAQVKALKIWAKPMSAPMTFKITTFAKECKNARNLVSIGDGNSERIATLNMRSGADLESKSSPEAKNYKSVKLIEMPTCQELISQHELLQARLADIAAYPGSLDLKARFAVDQALHAVNPSPNARDSRVCTFVHMAGPLAGTSPALGRGSAPHGNWSDSNTAAARTASYAAGGQADGVGCHLPRLASMRGKALKTPKSGMGANSMLDGVLERDALSDEAVAGSKDQDNVPTYATPMPTNQLLWKTRGVNGGGSAHGRAASVGVVALQRKRPVFACGAGGHDSLGGGTAGTTRSRDLFGR
eukprot:TRINITY_DN121265_c0_g1_i1.p1 TRINITY_DN121265_c0_g1~~TRINITY_DN121265_c0_g1_i1.p1  ORF type:complete len:420 (-),score=55.23 TRINITY_DN121265_c0_g1_i1:250-1509(-)